MVLRQAEEAARAGRFDEALALVSRPDVADHHHAVKLRGRFVLDLIARASRRGGADDTAGAIADLDLAERLGAAPDILAEARLGLADRVAVEVLSDLDAGEPARVVERVEHLARHKIGGPALRRAREVAESWQAMHEEARRGEFGRAGAHLDRAERLAGATAQAALASCRRDLEARQKAASPRVEALNAALAAGQWPETLRAAEAVLETVPEHPAARQARARAWQQIAAIAPSASWPDRGARMPQANAPSEPEPIRFLDATEAVAPALAQAPPGANAPRRTRPIPPVRLAAPPVEPGPSGRFLLWVDTVGGYLVCLDDRVTLGRAGPDSQADIAILGDLAREHAALRRDGEGYVVHAHHPTFVNGKPVRTAPLRDGDVIRLGDTVELEFRQPSPVSSTARLAIVSRHRLPLAVDGALLMAETCIIGPSSQAHVTAPGLGDPVVLYRQGPALWCRASGGFDVDGRPHVARGSITLQSSVMGEGFSFSLEALGPPSSQV